jgi:amino acid transporter
MSGGLKTGTTQTFALRHLVIFGLAFVTPAAPALIYGDLLIRSEGAPVPAYIIAFIAILFTAYSYGQLSRSYVGPVYIYVREGIGAYAGSFAGWASLLFYCLASATAFRVGALFAITVFPSVPYVGWVVLFTVVVGAVIFLGVRGIAIASSVIVYLVTAIVAIYILVCVFAANRGTGLGAVISDIPLRMPDAGLTPLIAGGGFACLSFLGFDAVTAVSNEARDAKKNIGRAIFIVCVVAGLLFFLQIYASGLIWPDYFELETETNALFEVGNKAGGPPMVYLCIVSVILPAFSVGIAGQTAARKTLRAMREREAVARFVNPPRLLKGAWGYGGDELIVTLAITFVFALLNDSTAGLLGLTQFFGCFCLVVVNMAAVIRFYFKKKRRHIFTGLLLPAVGFFISLYLWINVDGTYFGTGVWMLLICVVLLIPDIVGLVKAKLKR